MSYKLTDDRNMMQEHDETARPATSCHVWWRAVDMEHTGHDEFQIKCSARVRESTGATYFALIAYQGGNSGGYGGIQEDEQGRKLFIFSVWDSPHAKVKSTGKGHHANCIIRPFGGEGNGMQCLLYANWEIGSTVTQVSCILRPYFVLKFKLDDEVRAPSCRR